MIARHSGATLLPRVIWRRTAKRSLNELMSFLATSSLGDSRVRKKEIEDAVDSLRHSPLRCPVADVKEGLTFRRLIVGGRFFVYYVYTPPRGVASGGTLSIRSVKHAASQNPFLGVREASEQPSSMLTTREGGVPATA